MNEQVPKAEQEPNVLEQLKEAFAEKNIEAAKTALRALDAYLVPEGNMFTLREQDDFEPFVLGKRDSCKIYLGDGGMSRLVMNKIDGVIHLEVSEYNSSEEVKARWKEISAQN